MSEDVAVSSSGSGLSEIERVVDTFVAPSKTFVDILRSSRWWLPFVLMVLVTVSVSFVVDKQVGYARVAENQIHQSPKQEDQFNQLTAEQRTARLNGMAVGYRYSSYGSFVFILIFVAIVSLLYWATFNFGLGARTTYGQMIAVSMYASLPRLITGVLTIVTLLFGGDAESYDMRNPVGTNIAYYLPDAGPAIKAALGLYRRDRRVGAGAADPGYVDRGEGAAGQGCCGGDRLVGRRNAAECGNGCGVQLVPPPGVFAQSLHLI